MMAAALRDEHELIIRTVQCLKQKDTIPVFENFVSGPGLYNIYKALCMIGGKAPIAESTGALLAEADNQDVRGALRLFHEFFGLFAQVVVVSGHAYGGLYLTGGVLENLVEAGLFDFKHFEKFFVLQGVESVTEALASTPVVRITDSALAMKGLLGCMNA